MSYINYINIVISLDGMYEIKTDFFFFPSMKMKIYNQSKLARNYKILLLFEFPKFEKEK